LIELAVTATETQESANSTQIHPVHISAHKHIALLDRQTSWSDTVKSSR